MENDAWKASFDSVNGVYSTSIHIMYILLS